MTDKEKIKELETLNQTLLQDIRYALSNPDIIAREDFTMRDLYTIYSCRNLMEIILIDDDKRKEMNKKITQLENENTRLKDILKNHDITVD